DPSGFSPPSRADMKRVRVKLCGCTTRDAVRLSPKHANWTDANVIALTGWEDVRLSSPGLLMTCDLVEGCDEACVGSAEAAAAVLLHVHEHFIRRHGLSEPLALVSPLCWPRLSRLSVLAADGEQYEGLRDGRVLRDMAEKGRLCRVGDCLQRDLVVVDCQPTRQGLLAPDTQVLVVHRPMEGRSQDLAAMLGLVRYAGQLVLPTLGRRRACSQSPASVSLGVHVASWLPFLGEEGLDPLNSVFLSKGMLAMLGLTPGAWVWAQLQGAPSTSRRRAVTVSCAEKLLPAPRRSPQGAVDSSPAEVALLSPQLWFHLQEQPSILVQPGALLCLTCPGQTDSLPPPYAIEFHLAMVHSPGYSVQLHCAALLQQHFARPRYLCKGDIITISLRAPFSQPSPPRSSAVAFFRVTQMRGPSDAPGFVCHRDHSRLYQAGTTRSYVPSTMEAYAGRGPPHPVWDSPLPPHLGPCVERLQSLVMPFLLRPKDYREVLYCSTVNCQDLIGDTAASTEARIKAAFQKASYYTPCVTHLVNIQLLGQGKELGSGGEPRVVRLFGELARSLNADPEDLPVLLLATTCRPDGLHPDLASLFLHHVAIPYPGEEARVEILDALLSASPKSSSVDVSYLGQRTAGFALGDLSALVAQGTKEAYTRLRSLRQERPLCLSGPQLLQCDLQGALEGLQSSQAHAVGAPHIPTVHWHDIGGLGDAKRLLTDTLQLPLRHPQLLEAGLKRSGVLLYGPPGTGKTLLAKAVATECSLSFLSVKGPELINMYVGQSEENVRAVFARARSAAPCVIFFDELDSLAPNRGRSGDSGGVMDRVVSQLLAEMDGLNKSADVFVIGATNRPDLLDPAILRPGRFDQLLYVGIPSDRESQLKVLKALTRRFHFAQGLDLGSVLDACPSGLTGADFYSLCSAAMASATRNHIQALERGDLIPENQTVLVTLDDFKVALKDLVPSVSPAELERYNDIRQKMSSTARPTRNEL
ncbi:unnamed protein product, partial [Ixodes hexagonus]